MGFLYFVTVSRNLQSADLAPRLLDHRSILMSAKLNSFVKRRNQRSVARLSSHNSELSLQSQVWKFHAITKFHATEVDLSTMNQITYYDVKKNIDQPIIPIRQQNLYKRKKTHQRKIRVEKRRRISSHTTNTFFNIFDSLEISYSYSIFSTC